MKYTVAVPKDMLIKGFMYKYYIEAEKKGYECLPELYGNAQNRRLELATNVLSGRGN